MEGVPNIEFEDIRIAVPWGFVCGRWYGNRKVRPIVALHGWLDNLGTWDPMIPLLLPSHVGILCIDFPGHGRSSRLPPGMVYHVFDYVRIVIRIMKEYNWHKISLMGHSMGAVVSIMYTALFPHTVDLLIAIDIAVPLVRNIDVVIAKMRETYEKGLIEDERAYDTRVKRSESPCYTYDELEAVMIRGTSGSVLPETCKYVLNRNIEKSLVYPHKYYFSRDPKSKFNVEVPAIPELNLELTRRIRNIPHLVIKAKRSSFIGDWANEAIASLAKHNPLFEMHELDGTHHVNLNNADECAALLRPFIAHHRPPTLESWTMDETKEQTRPGKKTKSNRKARSKL